MTVCCERRQTIAAVSHADDIRRRRPTTKTQPTRSRLEDPTFFHNYARKQGPIKGIREVKRSPRQSCGRPTVGMSAFIFCCWLLSGLSSFPAVFVASTNDRRPGYLLWVYEYTCQFNDKRIMWTPFWLDSCRAYASYNSTSTSTADILGDSLVTPDGSTVDYNPGRIHVLPSYNVRVNDGNHLGDEQQANFQFEPFEHFFDPEPLKQVPCNAVTLKDFLEIVRSTSKNQIDLAVVRPGAKGKFIDANNLELQSQCQPNNFVTLPEARHISVYGHNVTVTKLLFWEERNGTELMQAIRPYEKVLVLGFDSHSPGKVFIYENSLNYTYVRSPEERRQVTEGQLKKEDLAKLPKNFAQRKTRPTDIFFQKHNVVKDRAARWIQFAPYIKDEAQSFIRDELQGQPFLAVHWRFGGHVVHAFDESSFVARLRYWLLHLAKNTTVTQDDIVVPKRLVLLSDNFDEASQAHAFSRIHHQDDDKLDRLSKAFLSVERVRYKPPPGSLFDKDPGILAVVEQAIAAHAEYFLGTMASTFSIAIQDSRQQEGKSAAYALEDMKEETDDQQDTPSDRKRASYLRDPGNDGAIDSRSDQESSDSIGWMFISAIFLIATVASIYLLRTGQWRLLFFRFKEHSKMY